MLTALVEGYSLFPFWGMVSSNHTFFKAFLHTEKFALGSLFSVGFLQQQFMDIVRTDLHFINEKKAHFVLVGWLA